MGVHNNNSCEHKNNKVTAKFFLRYKLECVQVRIIYNPTAQNETIDLLHHIKHSVQI